MLNICIWSLILTNFCFGHLLNSLTATQSTTYTDNWTPLCYANYSNDMNLFTWSATDTGGNSAALGAWLQFQSPSPMTIASFLLVYIEYSWTSYDVLDIRIGNSSPPYLNPACKLALTKSGWYACSPALTGTYFGFSRYDKWYTELKEVMAWSEFYIQHHYLSIAFGGASSTALTIASNAVIVGPQILTLMAQTTYAVTAVEPIAGYANLTLQLNGEVMVKSLIIVPANGTNQNLQVLAYSTDQTVVLSQTLSTFVGNYEFILNQFIQKLVIRTVTTSSAVSISTIGILCACNCQTTKFGLNVPAKPVNPSQSSVIIFYKGSVQTVTAYTHDAVSYSCGVADGLTYCGARTLQIIDLATNLPETTLITQSYSSVTGIATLTINATLASQIGVHQYAMYVYLSPNTSLSQSYNLLTSLFTVDVQDPCCSTTLLSWTTNLTSTTISVNLPNSLNFLITAQPKDTISNTYGNLDGYTQCGLRTLLVTDTFTSLSVDPATYTYNPSTGLITITPTVEGIYYYTFKFALTDQPLIISSTVINLIVTVVDLCPTTSLLSWTTNLTSTTINLSLPDSLNFLIPSQPKDSISNSNGNLDGYTYCGSRTLLVTDTLTTLSIDPTTYTYNPITGLITIIPPAIGTYKYTLKFQLTQFPLKQSPTVIDLTVIAVDPCLTTTLLAWTHNQTITTITFYLPGAIGIQTNQPQDLVSQINSPNDGYTKCGLRQMILIDTITAVAVDPALYTFNQVSGLLKISPVAQGTYYYSLKFKLANYPLIFSSTIVNITINVLDPCLVTSLLGWTTNLASTTMNIYLTQSANITVLTLPQDSVSQVNGNNDGFTFCGGRSLAVTQSATGVNVTTYTFISNILQFSFTAEGTYTYTLKYSLTSYPTKISLTVINITVIVVDLCNTTSLLSWPTNITTTTVNLNLPNSLFISLLAEPKDSASSTYGNADGYTFCGLRELVITNATSGIQLSPTYVQTTGLITLTPPNNGTYLYTLYFKLTKYQLVQSSMLNITINAFDLCLTTTLLDWNTNQTSTIIDVVLPNLVNVTMLTDPKDQVSNLYGNMDGYTFCGYRNIILTDALTGVMVDPQFYFYDDTFLILQIRIPSAGVYNYKMQYYLTAYPTIFSATVVNLTINATEINTPDLITVNKSVNTAPFLENNPVLYYEIHPGESLQLDLFIADDQRDRFYMNYDLAELGLIENYCSECGQYTEFAFWFDIRPPVGAQEITKTMTLLAQEHWTNANPDPLNTTWTFTFKITNKKVEDLQTNNTNSSQKNQTKNNATLVEFKPITTKKYDGPNIDVLIKIESISRTGFVTIVFNQPLEVQNYTIIVKYQCLSYEENISFNWNLTLEKIDSIYIQLNFSKPYSVSIGNKLDNLEVYLSVKRMYDNKFTKFVVAGKIPRQMGSASLQKSLKVAGAVIGETMQNTMYVYLFGNVLLGGAPSMLWGLMQQLQLISSLPQLQIQMPANIELVLEGFNKITNMHFFDEKQQYDYTIGRFYPIVENFTKNQTTFNSINTTDKKIRILTVNDLSDDLQKNVQVQGTVMAENLLLFFIFIIIFIILVNIFYIHAPICVKRVIDKIKELLMFSPVIQYVMNTYLDKSIDIMFMLYNFGAITIKTRVFVCSLAGYLLFIPIIIYVVLYKYRQNLGEKEIQKRIGSFYLKQNTSIDSAIHWPVSFLFRRLIFGFTVSFLQFGVFFQISLTIYLSMLTIIYLIKWKPMDDNLLNNLLIFNEFIFLFACHLITQYTDYILDKESAFKFGYIFLANLAITLFVNLIIFVYLSIITIRLHAKRCLYRRSERKKMKNKIKQEEITKLIKESHQRELKRQEQVLDFLENENKKLENKLIKPDNKENHLLNPDTKLTRKVQDIQKNQNGLDLELQETKSYFRVEAQRASIQNEINGKVLIQESIPSKSPNNRLKYSKDFISENSDVSQNSVLKLIEMSKNVKNKIAKIVEKPQSISVSLDNIEQLEQKSSLESIEDQFAEIMRDQTKKVLVNDFMKRQIPRKLEA